MDTCPLCGDEPHADFRPTPSGGTHRALGGRFEPGEWTPLTDVVMPSASALDLYKGSVGEAVSYSYYAPTADLATVGRTWDDLDVEDAKVLDAYEQEESP